MLKKPANTWKFQYPLNARQAIFGKTYRGDLFPGRLPKISTCFLYLLFGIVLQPYQKYR